MATEAWIFTLLYGDDIPKGGLFASSGTVIGAALTLSIFTPLNNLKWLNSVIFKENPRMVKIF